MLTPIYNFRKSAGRARTAPRSGSAGIERRRMIDPKYGANMPIQVAFARMLEESTRRAHRLSIYVGVRRKAADREGALLSHKTVRLRRSLGGRALPARHASGTPYLQPPQAVGGLHTLLRP